jgi:hypothetical protein
MNTKNRLKVQNNAFLEGKKQYAPFPKTGINEYSDKRQKHFSGW